VLSVVFLLLLGQSFQTRSRKTRVSTAHYYNLSVVQHTAGDTDTAIQTLGKALERKPGQPEFLLDRAIMSRELGRFDDAQNDLTALTEMRGLPSWLLRRVAHEQAQLITQRREPR
jgi:Flp pilus assembly protein TadD